MPDDSPPRSKKGVLHRADAPDLPPTQFYIKGSYVLDYVFATKHARDVDVFYDQGTTRPTSADINKFCTDHGFNPPLAVDARPVPNLERLDGGTCPNFNFERWHIREDGQLYELQDTDNSAIEESGIIPGLSGYSLHVTRIVALSRVEARRRRTVLLPWHTLSDSSSEDNVSYLTKCLEKLGRHRELYDPNIEMLLKRYLDLAQHPSSDFEAEFEASEREEG